MKIVRYWPFKTNKPIFFDFLHLASGLFLGHFHFIYAFFGNQITKFTEIDTNTNLAHQNHLRTHTLTRDGWRYFRLSKKKTVFIV